MLGKEIKILLYIFSTYWKLLYKYGDLGKKKIKKNKRKLKYNFTMQKYY